MYLQIVCSGLWIEYYSSLMSARKFIFQAPTYALRKLTLFAEVNLVSYRRDLTWRFLQSLIYESADFQSLDLLKRIMQFMPFVFDDIFDDVTETATREEILNTIRAIYTTFTPSDSGLYHSRWVCACLDCPNWYKL